MAAGLGTRMQSATPKHLHPLLGRRMVDWVIALGAGRGRRSVVVVASPDDARRVRRASTVAVQEEPRGTGDAVRCARDGARPARRRRARALRRHAAPDRRAAARARRDASRRARAAATVLSFEPADRAPLRPHRPRRSRRLARDRRGARRDTRGARDQRGQLLDLRLPRREALAGARAARAAQRPGRALPDRHDRPPRRRRRARRRARRPGPGEVDGVNTRVELAAAAAALRDRINDAHMLAGVTIVDPAIDLDRRRRRARAGRHDPPVHRPARAAGRRGAEVGRTRSRSTQIGPCVGPFCYLRPGTVLEAGREGRHVRGDQELPVGARTKVPHLSYIGDAEIGEDTNVAAGNITANFAHVPGSRRAHDRSGSNVRTGVDNDVRCSRRRSATTHGSQPARSSPRMCLRVARAVSRRGR